MNISFPTSLSEFQAYQEFLTGAPSNNQQKKLYAAVVGLSNQAFEDGRAGGCCPDVEQDFVDYCMIHGEEALLQEETVLQIISSTNFWCTTAYLQGRSADK